MAESSMALSYPYDHLIAKWFGWLIPYRRVWAVAQIPTFLTIIRILELPCVIAIKHALENGNRLQALGWCIAIVALAFTDAFDGSFARMLEATSRLGAVLDPIIDKAFAAFAYWNLYRLLADLDSWLGTWMVFAMVITNVVNGVVLLGGLYYLLRKYPIQHNQAARIKFHWQRTLTLHRQMLLAS